MRTGGVVRPSTLAGGRYSSPRNASRDLVSIARHGVLTAKHRGRLKAGWLHAFGRVP